MWSYAYDPTPWCKDVCKTQVKNTLSNSIGAVTCEECMDGLHNVFVTTAKKEVIQGLVDYMKGPAFCERSEKKERCKRVVTELISLAIPPLVADEKPQEEKSFCHLVLGAC